MCSLENICLDLIVQKFDRFLFAFASSKDGNQQKNFKFLQRRFSCQLAAKLYKAKNLKEQYLEFLINEHLTFLDSNWLKNTRYRNSMEDVFRRLPNIARIRFTQCNDDLLKYIAKFCPKIIEIDVKISYVTDNGLQYLCKSEHGLIPCPELKNVFIKPSRHVTHKGSECLIRNLPSLERIDYPAVPLVLYSIHKHDFSISQKVQHFNLVALDLLKLDNLTYYTDVLQACLDVCPKLESLACCISDKMQLNLFTNTSLKKLNLQFLTPDPKINVDDFLKTNGWRLTFLQISKCILTVSLLAKNCPNLREFYAYHVKFTDDDNLEPCFPCLMKCSFLATDPSASKAVCKLFSSSPILEYISFKFSILSLNMKDQILMWCNNPSAKIVHFGDIRLEKKFLRDILLSCPSLKEMCLNRCIFDDVSTDEFLNYFSIRLPNKPCISFKHDISLEHLDEIQDMLKMGYYSHYDTTAQNKENNRQEEYKSSRFYDSLFKSIAFGYVSDDDWRIEAN